MSRPSRVRSPPRSVREVVVRREFGRAGGFAVADSADGRANSRRNAPPRAAVSCARTRRCDDRSVAVCATLTTLGDGRPHGELARRSDEGHDRHARTSVPGTARRHRRRSIGVDAQDFERRGLLGHHGEALDHRMVSSLARRHRSGAAPVARDDRRVWIDLFDVPRRRGVLGVRNRAIFHCADPFEEPRSTSRSAGRHPLGRRDSRSEVAHRRRDEAKDFERAPCNATSDLGALDLS